MERSGKEGGVPNGNTDLLTPFLEPLVIPFRGEIKVAA